MSHALELGTRRELFVDEALVDRLDHVERVLHAPERREVVWQAQKPWENSTSGYFNLFRDGGRICMYHRGHSHADDDQAATTNLLESVDGITFTRPNLGLYEFEGVRENNIVFRGVQAHNIFVFRDDNPAAPADQRYKAVGGGWMKLFGLVSPDGLRWRLMSDEPLACKGVFDSLNVVHWDPARGRYRMFARWWDEGMKVRAIQMAESTDFIHWDDPRPFTYEPGVPSEHFYTNATVPCPGAEQILLSFPMRFVPERKLNTEGMTYPGDGLSDAVMMSSRDGINWDRSFVQGWVRPGHDPRRWTHRGNMPAVGIVTGPDEWSMYVSEHYGWSSNRLRRLALRPWGFVSVRAGAREGELLTRPVRVGQGELRLNFATSAIGSVQVEVRDESGRAIPGFELAHAPKRFGDELDAPYHWAKADFHALAGRTVRLRVMLQDADLFALRVADGA